MTQNLENHQSSARTPPLTVLGAAREREGRVGVHVVGVPAFHRTSWQFVSQISKPFMSFDLAIEFVGLYSKEMTREADKGLCTRLTVYSILDRREGGKPSTMP